MADPMAHTAIIMPKLGLTMSEGVISEWHVAPGDEVQMGQLLFVVETDKISSEVEAPAPGRIRELLVAAGETVDVGAAVATWSGPGQIADIAAGLAEVVAEPMPPSPAPSPPVTAGGRRLSTPLARRLAARENVDIALIAGTGPRGRIQAHDVQAVMDSRIRPTAPPVPASSPATRDLRPLIAARVTRSKAEIPHFYLTADVAFDALNAVRRDCNTDPAAPRKLSVTALLGAAVARALVLCPQANVVWRGGRAEALPGLALGIAVDTPGGVMAPIVSAGGGVYAFAAALDAAVDRARKGRLSAADLGDAAIGISNVGMFGVRSLTPIIDPDQTFMLGVGAPHGVFRPDARGNPVAVQEVTLSLACDHRAIDGAGAARFLSVIAELIEQPARLLIPLV